LANLIVIDEEAFKKFVGQCPDLRYNNGDQAICYTGETGNDDTPFIYPIAICEKEGLLEKMNLEKRWWGWKNRHFFKSDRKV